MLNSKTETLKNSDSIRYQPLTYCDFNIHSVKVRQGRFEYKVYLPVGNKFDVIQSGDMSVIEKAIDNWIESNF